MKDIASHVVKALIVAGILGAFSVSYKVTRLEAQLAALEDRTNYLHGADTR